MSKLAEFRRAEQALKEQLALLEKLQGDSGLKREMEFEDKLKALMADYGMDLAKVVDVLEPRTVELEVAEPTVVKPRLPRQVKVYVQPVTGKRIETKSGNHALLKAWKAEFGSDVVEGWRKA
ncbi:DNA binding protein [Pseudomonas sp. MAP12]|uniref:DNA binding protein n=1 Tax=Geopseudomonas aromaticivorans TaxID=2849492 RepID=A0ABS6MWZ7_9GAMM|nr:histone-like nucleoid-structuring protein, MvaT/MvaU family [Pseudomonas aromaticivorans]MBV2133270.1 DNA binding protein [Pseudomonas aromaticivorans]